MSVFVAVAEDSGFAPAARRLNISPPSVTRAVSELEARLGARLLHRTTRSVRLTEAGQRYLADCRRILSEIEEADRHAAGIHAAPHGMVSVSASALFGRMVLAPILLDLLDRYPDISVTTLFVDRMVHLIDEGIDVAVRIAELPDSSLSAIRVGTVRPVLCGSPDYLAARGSASPANGFSGPRDDRFREYDTGRRMDVRQQRQELWAQTALPAAREQRRRRYRRGGCRPGDHAGLSYMIAPQLQAGALEIVLEDYEPPAVPIHVLHKEPGQTSARVRAVVDYLAQRLRTDPALDS